MTDPRLERLLGVLESLHEDRPTAADPDAERARLAHATQLLERLAGIVPALAARATERTWDDSDALTARATLDIYERAVHELRALAMSARSRIERAHAMLTEAQQDAKRCRRAIEKQAPKLSPRP